MSINCNKCLLLQEQFFNGFIQIILIQKLHIKLFKISNTDFWFILNPKHKSSFNQIIF